MPTRIAYGLASCLLVGSSVSWAQEASSAVQWDAQLWIQHDSQRVNTEGPLALANSLQQGIAPVITGRTTALAELRARSPLWNVSVGADQQNSSSGTEQRSWVNELALNHDSGNWQFSLGRKVVAWDVGYAFRPNDMVQQEDRRGLGSGTLQGHSLALAEHFGDESSFTAVLVHPGESAQQLGAQEPALALRYFQRQGSADWHGFARWAERTGGSVGAALAWVTDESLELHGSVRYRQRHDTIALSPFATAVTSANPWLSQTNADAVQALVGASWTNAHQVSLLVEAWWDGTALGQDDWAQWRKRNQNLRHQVGLGAPTTAVAGNLAWQSSVLSANPNLQRNNLFARLSWDVQSWQWGLDVLLHPDDGGQLVTSSVTWKGDRIKVQAAWRSAQGPDEALLMQLPAREQAYVRVQWAF